MNATISARHDHGARVPKRAKAKPTVQGHLELSNQADQAFTATQVELLAAVDSEGSITGAAKKVGVSYKPAWDRIDAMNNLSETPLVLRSAGGAHPSRPV